MVRAVIGGLFVGHGTQKLFGWFGGHGPEATGQFFENVGMRPGRRNAIAAWTAEAVGGALVVAGLFTPLAGAAPFGTERCGTHWAIAQLAAGAAGSELISRLGQSTAPAEDTEVASQPSGDDAQAAAPSPA